MKTALMILTLAGTLTNTASAYDNYCNTRNRGDARSLCQGRVIPASQARNINRQDLECSGNSNHFIRQPQKYSFNEWSQHINSGNKESAQALRQQLPLIEWEGNIHYETVETWSWQSCDLVTSSFHCGEKTVEEPCTLTRQVIKKDETTGADQVVYEQYESTCEVKVPETCYADITHNENWKCSDEKISFDAKYERPSISEWNPKIPGYIDAIPNKYDLLPGELEDVQIVSNSGLRSTLQPYAEIGGAWNKYDVKLSGSAVGAQCKQFANEHLTVRINTLNRLGNKKTPNAFRLPVDAQGNKINPIEADESGKPTLLRLDDSSAATMNMIAEQSRNKTSETEGSVNVNGDSESLKEQTKNPAFFRNTKVTIKLLKTNSIFPNTQNTQTLYGQDGDFVTLNENAFSSDEDIALADYWHIPLDGGLDGSAPNIYLRKSRGTERALKPDQDYTLNISMYQKGAKGLYLQDCEEDPTAWQCKWYGYLFKRTESDYYSDALSIPFKTAEASENNPDKRDWMDKFWDIVK